MRAHPSFANSARLLLGSINAGTPHTDRLDGANLPGRRQDIGEIAEAIRDIIAMAPGTRPKRIDIDPQGREVGKINDLTAQLQRDFLGRMGVADLLEPTVSG